MRGSQPSEIREAEQRLTRGLALQKAEPTGQIEAPDPALVRGAERKSPPLRPPSIVPRAIRQLNAGPDQFAVRAAERECSKHSQSPTAQSSKDGDVATARKNLGDAQDRLAN